MGLSRMGRALTLALLGSLAVPTLAHSIGLASGETGYGYLDLAGGYAQSWTISGAAGDRVILTTSGLSGGVQPEIYLYPPGGGPAEAWHAGAATTHRLEWVLAQTGAYTLVVQESGANATGSYAVAYANIRDALSSPGDPDGGPIGSGETRSGQILWWADTDLFQFTGAAGDVAVLTAARTSGAMAPEMYVYPPDGGPPERVAASGAASQQLVWGLAQTGTYTVVIQDSGLNSDGYYAISLALIPGPTTSTIDLDGGTIASGETKFGSIDPAADTDLFQFEGTAGDLVVLTASGLSGGVAPEMYVYAPGGALPEKSHTGLAIPRLEWVLAQTGIYTVVLQDNSWNSQGMYALALAKIPGATTSADDPDGGLLAPAESRRASLSVPADTDLYQFEGVAGDLVILATSEVSFGVAPEIRVYPPGGVVYEQRDIGSAAAHRAEWVLAQTGTYTVVVEDNSLNSQGEYGISFVKIPGATTSATDADGGPIASGETKLGYLAHQADADVYQFTGQAGDLVVITAAENTGGVEPEIFLYPPGGVAPEASATEVRSDQRLEWRLLQSGIYTILVQDSGLNEEGYYALALARIPGAATSPSDADGGPILSGQSKTGVLLYEADTDLYTFYGEAGNRVVIAASPYGSAVEPDLYLYDPAGNLEQSVKDTVGLRRGDWVLAKTGVYTLLVGDSGLNEQGYYAVSLLRLPGLATAPGDPNDSEGGLIESADLRYGATSTAADLDAFQFYGNPGNQIVVELNRYSGGPVMHLYPPDGGPAEASSLGTVYPRRLRHTLKKRGLYTILVSEGGGSGTGYYSIKYTNSATSVRGVYGTYPPNGTTVDDVERYFRWDAVSRAVSYELQYGTDPLKPLATISTGTGRVRRFPARAIGKPYFWRVVARTSGGGRVYGPYQWFKFMARPVVHRDTFFDGSPSGDPDWLPYRYASWTVNSNKQYESTAGVDNRSIYKDYGTYLTGRLQTLVRLLPPSSTANAGFLFSYQGDHQRYRYVTVKPGRIVLGQVGRLGGQGGGIKRTKFLPLVINKWYRLRIDLDSRGWVKVYLNSTKPRFSFKFAKVVPGWVGYAADKAKSRFDNFYSLEGTVFP